MIKMSPCTTEDVARLVLSRTPTGEWKRLPGDADDQYTLNVIRNYGPEMRFRLVYDGPLGSGYSHQKGDNKWLIRKNLEPQLAELWTFKPALLGHAEAYAAFNQSRGENAELWTLEMTPPERNRESLLTPIQRGAHGYLPIVRSNLFLTCTLDILFLRKDGPGDVVSNAGDLDNRIKCLFDGLRPPEINETAPDDLQPEPFHCLLEDDRLITSFAIRTDRLLNRANDPKDTVLLVIDVIVVPTRVKVELNSGFTWD